MLKADKGAEQKHGRRSGEQPWGPGKGRKSSGARASRAREPSAAWEGNQQHSPGCTARHPSQGLSPRSGGTPIYSPPEATISSQQVPEAGRAGGSHGSTAPGSGGTGGRQTPIPQLEKGQDTGTKPLCPVTNAARGWFNGRWPSEAEQPSLTGFPIVAASPAAHPAN